MIRRTPWLASSSGRSRTYYSVEPAPATLAYTGSGRIQAPQGMVRKHIPPFTYK